MIKVSICIPAYRQVEYLRLTLESINAQKFKDYEVVVTDDSPDDSVEKLVTEFPLDGRLTYWRNPVPLGSPENWNECIRRARGELIKIIHHDDHFTDADSLGRFVALLDAHPEADFGFSATRVVDVSGGLTRTHCPTEKQLATLRERPHSLFEGNCMGAPSATIYRRKVQFEYDCGMKWLVDLDFYIRVLAINPRIAFTPQPLITTPTNAAHQVTESCRDNATVELFEYSRLFSKLDPAWREDPQVIGTWVRLFLKYRIRKLADFGRFGVAAPPETEYFETLLRHMRKFSLKKLFYRSLYPLVVFYRLYPHAPPYIRGPIRWVRNRVISLRERLR